MNLDQYPATITKKEQYTAGDVAILFGVSHRTACKMIDRGDLSGFTIPGSKERRVLHAEIVKYVSANPQYTHILAKIVTPEPK
ncbi:hypothetical protein SAMN05444166_4214 [Singulisphaera sp. GP187]|uniref:helix-turn-helix domain-containing protein n=1 Tax=Singulisphaera sp. GP187 TaxID=1882752 RepID=UPI0009270632|nr:helix-turn-helix domain-containing protein [Singulisphaera sp. GP187]SIO37743.1 hypothetical protein SAMN05444166_4214 [Singulisphaera sp. GP187]